MNADCDRFRSAPSFYAVASSRPISRPGRRAHRRDLRARPPQSPAVARRRRAPEKERRFEAGLVDLRQRAGLYAENPHGVEITDGVLYRARDHHPQPGAGRHLHRRDLPDRPRQVIAAATRDIQIEQIRFRAVRRARGPAPSLRLRARRGRAVARARLGGGGGIPPTGSEELRSRCGL